MPAKSASPLQKQITIRVPDKALVDADRIGAAMASRGLPLTQTAILRSAVIRGLAAMRADEGMTEETETPTKRARKTA